MNIKSNLSVIIVAAMSCACSWPVKNGNTTNADTVVESTAVPADTVKDHNATVSKVRAYLQEAFKDDISKLIIDSASKRFEVATYDLNGDGVSELFAGLTGPYFCGSGGCTWLLLDNSGILISKFTVSDYPIYISPAKSNGWSDLVIYSGGKNRRLVFNGKKYPGNPSMQPEYKSAVDGLPKILETDTAGKSWHNF